MRKIIKDLIVPLLGAIIFGVVLGKYVYKIYSDDLYDRLSSSKLYLIENGEYDSIDSMRENNNDGNYVYYKDNDKYRTVVGITNSYDNIDKIKELYDGDLKVMEYYVANDILDTKQYEYENMLRDSKDINDVKEAVQDILNLYRSDNNIRLIAIN